MSISAPSGVNGGAGPGRVVTMLQSGRLSEMVDDGLTVVVVTYNSRPHLRGLLSSLAEGLSGIDRWRLVVVDNNSEDGTPALIRDLAPDALLIESQRNKGYAAAINAGVRAADP